MIAHRARNISLSEALEIVCRGAREQQMDPNDNHGDDSLVEQLRWQEEAIGTFDDFL